MTELLYFYPDKHPLLRSFVKIVLLSFFLFCSSLFSSAQLTVTGTVFDASKRNYVEKVKVESTGGQQTSTDSMGRYRILVAETDSLTFTYNEKPTQKFPVKTIADINQFDISLQVHVKSRYNTLKEVVVIAKSYREDSLENRRIYSEYYDFHKPTVKTSITPGGAVGADLDEIINIFRFRRNKQLKAFRARLEQQEQDKFIDYRFSKTFVKRITQLNGAELDTFMVRYRPTYEFASMADEVTFNKYILNASYKFKLELLRKESPRSPGPAKN
ncbi:MAG TPA: hypothetical protein PLZ45_00790 [Ferruginibacter sp.]|nr:hypothetical protein [Ferruginibacter sp.]